MQAVTSSASPPRCGGLLRRAWIAIAGLLPLLPGATWGAGRYTVQGNVTYRKGVRRAAVPDVGARIWLFRGKQTLALTSGVRLHQFDHRHPHGLQQARYRPTEDAVRKSAMVLATYSHLHRADLAGSAAADGAGKFALFLPDQSAYTLLIESAASYGSYHLKRYIVRTVRPTAQHSRGLKLTFQTSHLDHHPHSHP